MIMHSMPFTVCISLVAPGYLRNAVSDIALGSGKSSAQYEATRFGMGTRSLSTWVAVGDVVMSLSRTISSQLPSPQGRPTSVHVENPQYIEGKIIAHASP